MEQTNNPEQEKEINLECSICLGVPVLPVATECGHVFCWDCINSWLNSREYMDCPICKNGIRKEKLIKLFIGNDNLNPNLKDDRPKPEQIKPVKNDNAPKYYQKILNNFGFYGSRENNERLVPPTEKEIKRSRLALLILIIGIILVILIFKD